MKKTIALFVCLVMLFTVLPIAAYAADVDVMPRANNVYSCFVSLHINTYGHATITAGYEGYEGITTNGLITITLQKRVLGLFWRDVDDCKWIYGSVNASYTTQFVVQLSDSGTYRVVANFSISGTAGANDNVEQTAEDNW